MNKKKHADIFTSTNVLKILSYLAENPGKELLGSEIQKNISISRAGIYIALRELIEHKLVSKTKRGKFLFYSLKYDEPVVRQYRVFKNILTLQSLINKLKPLTQKIILYGSTSRGEDYPTSDIDLFIVSSEPQLAQKTIISTKLKRKIQAVVKSPSAFSEIIKNEKIFYREVDRGITLWEAKQ